MADKINEYVGYARVSSKDQNADRQLIALKEAGVDEKNIFVDIESGKDFNRKNYLKMVRYLKPGKVLFITSIDRLGRDYKDLRDQWYLITDKKKADIVVLDMPILDTRRDKDFLGTFIADLVLSILSYVAESERRAIRQRQAEGIAAAKARGVKFGRPEKPLPKNFDEIYFLYKLKKITLSEAAKKCRMSEKTFLKKTLYFEKNHT